MVPRRKVVDGSDEPLGNGASQWHVVRGIPVVFILTMLITVIVQSAIAGWYASAMNYRVESIEKIQASVAPQGERLTRVEEKLAGVQSGISRIESLLQSSPGKRP